MWRHPLVRGRPILPWGSIQAKIGAKMYNEDDQASWISYNREDGEYRVYFQGALTHPKFSNRCAALSYLCALRCGLKQPQFSEVLTNARKSSRSD
jgi:hypothetical protein